MPYTPTPSTLKPAEVAVALVESAVLKHRTRLDMIFFKAVRISLFHDIPSPCLPVIADYLVRVTWTCRVQFMAGAMLSFGGLLSEVIQGGAAGLTASNPGIVKVLGGFVFPVGLVMCVSLLSFLVQLRHFYCIISAISWRSVATSRVFASMHGMVLLMFRYFGFRIVLQGQELLTSNMMVSTSATLSSDNVAVFSRIFRLPHSFQRVFICQNSIHHPESVEIANPLLEVKIPSPFLEGGLL